MSDANKEIYTLAVTESLQLVSLQEVIPLHQYSNVFKALEGSSSADKLIKWLEIEKHEDKVKAREADNKLTTLSRHFKLLWRCVSPS